MLFLLCGAGLYASNLAVGVLAKVSGRKFGAAHHVLYAVVSATTVAACLFAFEWPLLVTIAALAIFPFAKPQRALHPTLGVVGALGYAGALVAAFASPTVWGP